LQFALLFRIGNPFPLSFLLLIVSIFAPTLVQLFTLDDLNSFGCKQ
jgi:hypothetical protein